VLAAAGGVGLRPNSYRVAVIIDLLIHPDRLQRSQRLLRADMTPARRPYKRSFLIGCMNGIEAGRRSGTSRERAPGDPA
jgi:hypothetical protein